MGMPPSPHQERTSMIRGAVEILKDRLYYVALKNTPRQNLTISTTSRGSGEIKHKSVHFFNIDNELVYWNFFLDFGPLNLGQLYRFCRRLNDKLSSEELSSQVVCFYSSIAPAKRANAIYLICAWQVLYLGRTPEESFRGFMNDDNAMDVVSDDGDAEAHGSKNSSSPPPSPRSSMGAATVCPLPPFHDASPCTCTYDLNILDCLNGITKARMYGFFDFDNFDVEEYEHFEQVENGDLNWIVKDRFLAFAGPHYKRNMSAEGYCTLTPAHYIPYFKQKNVALVVRLNKKCYEEREFTDAGIRHLEQYYLDGSCPPMTILHKVIEGFESVPSDKAIAVHCKAGLGRTGTCIGAYIMKHYKFTAAEVIAWMRICRPGCVIGPQQHFLQDIEQQMWQEGSLMKMNVGKSIVLKENPEVSVRGEQKSESQKLNTTRSSRASSIFSGLRFGSLTVKEGGARQRLQEEQETKEAVVGRAGQAESLLAARHKPGTPVSAGWEV